MRMTRFPLVLAVLACSDPSAPFEYGPSHEEPRSGNDLLGEVTTTNPLVVELESFGCYHGYKSQVLLSRDQSGALTVVAQTHSLWGDTRGRIEQTLSTQQELELGIDLRLLRGPGVDQFCRTSTKYTFRWAGVDGETVENISDTECRGLRMRTQEDRIPVGFHRIALRALMGEGVE